MLIVLVLGDIIYLWPQATVYNDSLALPLLLQGHQLFGRFLGSLPVFMNSTRNYMDVSCVLLPVQHLASVIVSVPRKVLECSSVTVSVFWDPALLFCCPYCHHVWAPCLTSHLCRFRGSMAHRYLEHQVNMPICPPSFPVSRATEQFLVPIDFWWFYLKQLFQLLMCSPRKLLPQGWAWSRRRWGTPHVPFLAPRFSSSLFWGFAMRPLPVAFLLLQARSTFKNMPGSFSLVLYWFSTVAITNHCIVGGLKQQRLITFQFQMPQRSADST